MEQENMSEMIKNLGNILGKENIPDNLKELLNNATHSTDTKNTDSSSISPEMLSNLLTMLQSSSNSNRRFTK